MDPGDGVEAATQFLILLSGNPTEVSGAAPPPPPFQPALCLSALLSSSSSS